MSHSEALDERGHLDDGIDPSPAPDNGLAGNSLAAAAAAAPVDKTGNPYIDGLIYGVRWTSAPTFSFPTATSQYPFGYGMNNQYNYHELQNNFAPVTQQQQNATRAALIGQVVGNATQVQTYNSVSAFTKLAISEQGGLGQGANGLGDIRLAISSAANPTAYGYYPRQSSNPETDRGESGDIWFGTVYNGTEFDYRKPVLGNYAYYALVHELGHTLGLKHGHDGGAGFTLLPEDRDAVEFSLMSYRSYPGGPLNYLTVETYGHPQTYMMIDILALQTLYSANYDYNNGNTAYSWNPSTGQMSVNGVGQGVPGANRILLTIWDGGGTDIYDMSNYPAGVAIDLDPGAWSITSQQQRSDLGYGHLALGTVYNSYLFNGDPASLIENALGGGGNDTLHGNAGHNVLNGNGGADSMAGRDGDDSYVVDHSDDTVVETANQGTDTVYVRFSGYVLPANVEQGKAEEGFGNIELRGNDLANLLAGNAGSNALYGGADADVLYGMAGNDHLDGGSGGDALIGGTGNDTYIVDSLSDVVYEAPGQGADTLWTSVSRGLDNDFENIVLFGTATDAGGNGRNNIVTGNELGNNLYGGGGADSLYGHDGNDRLFGESGNDYMTGGKGTDAYYGGLGYDYAIIEQGGGVDYFVDWNVTRDRVVFDSAIFASLEVALAAAFQSETDVVIWDGSDGIVLQNAKLASLTDSNFLFV